MATIGTPFAFSAYAAGNSLAASFAIGTVTAAFCPVVATTASVFNYLATIAAMDTLAMAFTVIAIATNRLKWVSAMLTMGAFATTMFGAITASAAKRARVYFFGAIRAGNTVARIAILARVAILASLFARAVFCLVTHCVPHYVDSNPTGNGLSRK